jgi:hypothetical protein
MLPEPVSAVRHLSSRGHGVLRYGRGMRPASARERTQEKDPLKEWISFYPPSGVKPRPSERRYKLYIVILWVRYRLDNFPADLLFVI